MHELTSKYMRRLDLELHKFKMELEADNSGITGLIEKSNKKWIKLNKKNKNLKF